MAPKIESVYGPVMADTTGGKAVPDHFIEPGEQEQVYCVHMSFVITLGLTPAEEAALSPLELAAVLVANLEHVPCKYDVDKVELIERRVSAPSAVTAQD